MVITFATTSSSDQASQIIGVCPNNNKQKLIINLSQNAAIACSSCYKAVF